MFQIGFDDTGNVVAEGRLDAAQAPHAQEFLDTVEGGCVLDLARLEYVSSAGLGVLLEEARLPLRQAVRGACELLGLDPLHIANEGQFLAVLAPDVAEAGLAAVRSVPGGEEACLIGELTAEAAATVLVRTGYGSTRVVDMLVGDPLPRIC